MSAARVFVAECPLCRTKFETKPGSCPVCGGAELRSIHERMEAPTPIPVPTRKTPPPAAVRFHRAASPERAGTGVRKPVVPAPRPKKASLPPRGPDGRFLPRREAVARPATPPPTPPPTPRAARPAGPKRAIPAMRAAEALRRASGADPILAQQSVRATDVFSATFEHDGRPTRNPNLFQAFPFVSGNRNLGDLIADGFGGRPLRGKDRLMVATIFTAALARLHAANIVHADLKPANVQMVRIGSGADLLFRPLLVDMDFSVLADQTAPWHGDPAVGYVGTPGYFSPEHLRGNVPTTASDAFTAAIILCQLLAGVHPFASALGDDAEANDYRERVLEGRTDFGSDPPPLLPDIVAPELRPLLLRGLSPDPTKRPSVAELHAAAMEARRNAAPAAPASLKAPAVAPAIPPATRRPSRVTSLSRLVLTGPNGEFSTGGRFAITRTTLRRIVGEDARYAGDAPQFVMRRGEGGGWVVLPPPEPPRNPTWRNGAPLTEPATLAVGDTISIGPVKAKCSVSFQCAPYPRQE